MFPLQYTSVHYIRVNQLSSESDILFSVFCKLAESVTRSKDRFDHSILASLQEIVVCVVWKRLHSCYFSLWLNSVVSLCRPTCRCFRGSCCTVPGWPSRTPLSTWPSTSSCSWTPAPPPQWTPPNSCWTSTRTAREGRQTGVWIRKLEHYFAGLGLFLFIHLPVPDIKAAEGFFPFLAHAWIPLSLPA